MLELTINNYYESSISEFVSIVIDKLKESIINSLSRRQLQRVTEYLNSEYSPYYYLQELKNPITLYANEIFEGALDNLTYNTIDDKKYKIHIDPNAYVPNTNISYESAMSLITNGTLTFNPYPIFSDRMKDMDEEIPELFESYVEGEL